MSKYLQSFEFAQAGEMSEASQYITTALKLFDKEKAFFEAGLAYLQMGTIYRVSSIFDVAQCMFESATEIFTKLKAYTPKAEAYGNIGMLMVAQQRFDEAENYFNLACNCYDITTNIKGRAEIINQCALM